MVDYGINYTLAQVGATSWSRPFPALVGATRGFLARVKLLFGRGDTAVSYSNQNFTHPSKSRDIQFSIFLIFFSMLIILC